MDQIHYKVRIYKFCWRNVLQLFGKRATRLSKTGKKIVVHDRKFFRKVPIIYPAISIQTKPNLGLDVDTESWLLFLCLSLSNLLASSQCSKGTLKRQKRAATSWLILSQRRISGLENSSMNTSFEKESDSEGQTRLKQEMKVQLSNESKI